LPKGTKRLAENRKARHDYYIEECCEAGLVLHGTEVKSLRAGTVNLKDSFCVVKNGEMFVHNFHISPYEKGNIFNREPLRPKKLLLHKREIGKLSARVAQDGYAVIPLSVYLKDSRVKMEIALCKGKKLYDKRDTEAKRQAGREMERHMKAMNN